MSFGCVCEANPSSSNIDEWIGGADFIVEGEYIKDIDWRNSDNDDLNTINQGVDIYFLVSNDFKGDLKSDTIVINQWDNGNCTKVFRKEKNTLSLVMR